MWFLLTALISISAVLLEVCQSVNLTHASSSRIRVLFYLLSFLLGTGFLSILLYELLISNAFLSTFSDFARASIIGLSYLVLVRMKLFSFKVNEENIPFGLEYFHEKISLSLISHLNGLIEQDVYERAVLLLKDEKIKNNDLELLNRAKFKVEYINRGPE